MPKVNSEIEVFARIKVIGIGGSGKNATNHMVNSKVKGVEYIVMNTDAQDLHHSLANKKIHIGKNLTRGLGTGMNPELGRRAADETKEEIQEAIKGADMIFIAGGMGGGTGTGASPVVARTAKELGALTVAVVTRPFFFEGSQRMKLAEQGIENLKEEVDALIIIPNDRILNIAGENTTVDDAFALSDEILKQAVEGISDLITTPGRINVDFADVRSIMENAGSALMGIGRGSGEKRSEEAARLAINSPLLDISINGAKGVLFAIAGGEDLTMNEVQGAAKIITESIDPDAKVIFGTVKDDKLKKGEVKVTVIATGFQNGFIKKISIKKENPSLDDKFRNENIIKIAVDDEEDNSSKNIHKIHNSVINNKNKNQEKKEEEDGNIKNKIVEEIIVDDIEGEIKIIDDIPSDNDGWDVIPDFLKKSKLK